MQIEDFAQTILFSTDWKQKITSAPAFEDFPRRAPLRVLPPFPGRPPHLIKLGSAEFPKPNQLVSDCARGRLLHFFANHELLAMELMALMLLKFPQAESAFRLGIAHTIAEEQNHLRLYVDRMRELGVHFGDFPVSDYFWNALKSVESPLQFVVQMSLTLEQANLDFSRYYQKAVAAVGDEKTARVLEKVYREEIGHVKHGLHWFNQWREPNSEDDWDGYLRLLPAPMTARRAKGPLFCAAARRAAGFSERYIREMEVFTGSKGRPPKVWYYNPLCELEIARGKPGFTASEKVQRRTQDLQPLMGFLGIESDVVLVDRLPSASWLKEMQTLGFKFPEFRELKHLKAGLREAKIAGLEPWGWSPEIFQVFRSEKNKLIEIEGANGGWAQTLLQRPAFSDTGLAQFFSKNWSLAFLKDWLTQNPDDQKIFGSARALGFTFDNFSDAQTYIEQQLSKHSTLIAKAPLGTAGGQNKRILRAEEMAGSLGGWIRNRIDSQGSILIEPWLDKQFDLSLQMDISPTNPPRILGIRRFINGGRLEYRGTYLEPKLNSLSPQALRFLHNGTLNRWQEMASAMAESLKAGGLRGNVGVDAMIWKDSNAELRLRPIVEINPRWTMGRVALAIEKQLLPGTPAVWLFLPRRHLEAARAASARHPVQLKPCGVEYKIAEGVVFTSDPHAALEVLTILVAGEKALRENVWQL